MMPKCWIIAGVNGAGKTTFALEYLSRLSNCQQFINADLIAAGLSPLSSERVLVTASRIFLREIEKRILQEENFAFETTLSGRNYLKLIEKLHRQNWHIELLYLALPTLEMSLQRVAERVAHGGHNIPEESIKRRFSRSFFNLFYEYRYRVDNCYCFLNSEAIPQLIFEQHKQECRIINDELYQLLLKNAHL